MMIDRFCAVAAQVRWDFGFMFQHDEWRLGFANGKVMGYPRTA